LALELIEALNGGRAPGPQRNEGGELRCVPHASDPFAKELAMHARLARADETGTGLECLYLRRAAEHAERQFHNDEALRLWQELTVLLPADSRTEPLRRAGLVAHQAGRHADADACLTRALAGARAGGQAREIATTLSNFGVHLEQTGQPGKARECFEEALAIWRREG